MILSNMFLVTRSWRRLYVWCCQFLCGFICGSSCGPPPRLARLPDWLRSSPCQIRCISIFPDLSSFQLRQIDETVRLSQIQFLARLPDCGRRQIRSLTKSRTRANPFQIRRNARLGFVRISSLLPDYRIRNIWANFQIRSFARLPH